MGQNRKPQFFFFYNAVKFLKFHCFVYVLSGSLFQNFSSTLAAQNKAPTSLNESNTKRSTIEQLPNAYMQEL